MKTLRKANLRQLIKTNKYGKRAIHFYKSFQWEWETSADPNYDDITYHLTLEDAEKANSEIQTTVGWSNRIEQLEVEFNKINNYFDFREEFLLDDLDDYKNLDTDHVNEWEGFSNNGNSIYGDVIVIWNYEKYVGYARNFENVRYGEYNETESDLITGNEDRTFYSNMSILLTADEIEGMDDLEILEAVEMELCATSWKWNYFKNRPSREKIIAGLNLTIEEEDKEEE